MALWGTLWREILFDFYQKSNKIHGRSLSVNFCSEVNSENTDSKAALLANTVASSSKQAAQAKAKGLRSLLCAIIPQFRRVFLYPRPNGRPNRLKTRFSATVRVNYLPFPPELSYVRITGRLSGIRVRVYPWTIAMLIPIALMILKNVATLGIVTPFSILEM